MKIIILLTAWCFLLGSVFADEAPPKDWRSMNPEQLRAHVANLKTFSEAEKLLGKAPHPNDRGRSYQVSYKVTEKLRLSITCNDENSLSTRKLLGAVQSILLIEEDVTGHRVIWKIIADPYDRDGKFRSDQIDVPPTNKTQGQNKPVEATAISRQI
jgi:hypothetical protein